MYKTQINQHAESKLNNLPKNLNFIQKEKILSQGFTATEDYYLNTCRALSVLGSSCIGHSGTTYSEPGFYFVISNKKEIINFLSCNGKIMAPLYRKLSDEKYFMEQDFIQLKKGFNDIDYNRYYYFILYQVDNDTKIPDIRMKQIPRSDRILLNDEKDGSILKPYIDNLINDLCGIKKLFELVLLNLISS